MMSMEAHRPVAVCALVLLATNSHALAEYDNADAAFFNLQTGIYIDMQASVRQERLSPIDARGRSSNRFST
jgi:hypothetical protein